MRVWGLACASGATSRVLVPLNVVEPSLSRTQEFAVLCTGVPVYVPVRRLPEVGGGPPDRVVAEGVEEVGRG